jgi:hypothetical protein
MIGWSHVFDATAPTVSQTGAIQSKSPEKILVRHPIHQEPFSENGISVHPGQFFPFQPLIVMPIPLLMQLP